MRLLALLLFPFVAFAEPWVVYSQTAVPLGALHNPRPNTAGLIGEVSSLPYRVPEGKVLRIDGIALESFPTAPNLLPKFVLFPWLSDSTRSMTAQEINAQALVSCSAGAFTNTCPTRYFVPSGKLVNVTLVLGSPEMAGWTWGWHMYGELIDE